MWIPERSRLQQFKRSQLQQRQGKLRPVGISNVVAHKVWWGHLGPSCEGRLKLASHGVRYLGWDLHFTWEGLGPNAGFAGDLHSHGSFGRYSGAVVEASTEISDNNPDVFSGTGFHGPATAILCDDIVGLTSSGENHIHIEYDTTIGSIGANNPPCRGHLDVVLSLPYTYELLQQDCAEVYLQRDLGTVAPNFTKILEWEVASNSQSAMLSKYGTFFHGPCGPPDEPGLDPRTQWPCLNATWNGGPLPGGYAGLPTVFADWPIMDDYKRLVVTDLAGIASAGTFAQLFGGQDTGEYTMIGTQYRNHAGPPKACLRTVFTGLHYVPATDTIVAGVLGNVTECATKDAPGGNLAIDPPFIDVTNHENVEIEAQTDAAWGLVASGEADGSCACVGQPQPPFNVQAVNGGGVVVLTWDLLANDHDLNVDIFRSEVSGQEGLLQAAWGGQGNQYLDAQIASGHTYYYQLKARNAFGVSNYSDEVSVTVP